MKKLLAALVATVFASAAFIAVAADASAPASATKAVKVEKKATKKV